MHTDSDMFVPDGSTLLYSRNQTLNYCNCYYFDGINNGFSFLWLFGLGIHLLVFTKVDTQQVIILGVIHIDNQCLSGTRAWNLATVSFSPDRDMI